MTRRFGGDWSRLGTVLTLLGGCITAIGRICLTRIDAGDALTILIFKRLLEPVRR